MGQNGHGDKGEGVVESVNVKVKFTLQQATKSQRGVLRYSSTLSLTSALDGADGQRHAPAALPPGKDPVPNV